MGMRKLRLVTCNTVASGLCLSFLPTEAQWEYTCRAGTETPWYHHDIDVIGWYRENSNHQMHPVGQKLPNDWGLYDMCGNVVEWVQDWYDYYQQIEGLPRVLRGGSWGNNGRDLRSADRSAIHPGNRNSNVGFRLARGQVSSR